MSQLYHDFSLVTSTGVDTTPSTFIRGSSEEPKYVKSVHFVEVVGKCVMTFYLEREKIAEIYLVPGIYDSYEFRLPIKRDLGDFRELKLMLRPITGNAAVSVGFNTRYLIMK